MISFPSSWRTGVAPATGDNLPGQQLQLLPPHETLGVEVEALQHHPQLVHGGHHRDHAGVPRGCFAKVGAQSDSHYMGDQGNTRVEACDQPSQVVLRRGLVGGLHGVPQRVSQHPLVRPQLGHQQGVQGVALLDD